MSLPARVTIGAAVLVLLATACGSGAVTPGGGTDLTGGIDRVGSDRSSVTDAAIGSDGALPTPDASDAAVGDDAVVGDDAGESDLAVGDGPPPSCMPSCSGRICGDDGCGGSCGSCASGQSCDDSGQCAAGCTPTCVGMCGPDGCGGSCGTCAATDSCSDSGLCVPGCAPRCSGKQCGDDGCGGSCGTCAAGSCTEDDDHHGQCLCPTPAEVVVYTSRSWQPLAAAFAADPSPCANYYLSVPASADENGDKTYPRQGEAEALRALGPQIHALAEFHFASWSRVTSLTWYERGVEFRRRMTDRGYDVTLNDGWAINELPSTTRTTATTRQNIRDLVRGLHDGPAGSPPARGTVFVVGLGHVTVNVGPYKSNLETWLSDAPFWVDMNSYVRFFAQEVYTDPFLTCVAGTSVGERATHINEYVEHLARLAAADPTGAANTAQSYLSRAYVPLMNAVFDSPTARGYGNTVIPLDQMAQHISGQVYAVRAWASSHTYPDGRIGFGWDKAPGVLDSDLATLAERLASSLHHAYDSDGGSAARACSPSGAFTFCQCSVAGAQFNLAWNALGTW